MILFDSHAHINHERYSDGGRAELAGDIESSDVGYVADIGFDLSSSALAVENAGRWDWCYAVVGVHPHEVKGLDEDAIPLLKGLAGKPKVVAIGEIGLDYYRDLSPREDQQRWFRKQIRLALELGMPIVIHDRDSKGDTIRILTEEGAFDGQRTGRFPASGETGYPDARVLLHCFSGSAEEALKFISMGATISIAGPVTYSNNRKTVDVAARVPLAHLLVETDAPYLSPEPFRGKPNASHFVEFTAKKVAEIKGVSIEEVAATTCENAKRFYNIEN